jgi:hypothetical protein
VAAIVIAAAAVTTGTRLPPARLALAAGPADGSVPGVVHVHTSRSDGRATPEEVAAAAARAGLAFVVFTDHGDATRTPDPPTYRHGVLCLDGVEISGDGGHYLAVGLPAAPYPLGGEARAVVEDAARLGAFGIAAHPDSPKPDLQWRDPAAPVDAVELISLDTAWRAHAQQPGWRPTLRLLQAVATYPVRRSETIAALLADVRPAYANWEPLLGERRVVAVAGADAHGTLLTSDALPPAARLLLPLPGYETTFRTLSLRVTPARPLTGDAAADAAAILDAMREGRVYIAVDAIASPPAFQFTAVGQHGRAEAGAVLAADGPVTLRVRSNAPPGFTSEIRRGNEVVAAARAPEVVFTAPGGAAVYRAEIRATDRAGSPPWIISNPIYVRSPEASDGTSNPAPAAERVDLLEGKAETWRVETDSSSAGSVEVAAGDGGTEVVLRYTLGGGPAGGQFAALAIPTPGGIAAGERFNFTAASDRPLRLSVQARVAVSPDGDERWQRSVYVDPAGAVRTVFFDDLTPVGPTRAPRPPLDQVHSLVLVIDMTHSRPGAAGWLRITAASLER